MFSQTVQNIPIRSLWLDHTNDRTSASHFRQIGSSLLWKLKTTDCGFQQVWPDLAKFLFNFSKVFDKIVNLLRQNVRAIIQKFIVVYGQILKDFISHLVTLAPTSCEGNLRFNSGGSPGLVVMGEDSCSRGHGFESQRHILDGHYIFHIDLLKKFYSLFEKTETKWKRPVLTHFFKKNLKFNLIGMVVWPICQNFIFTVLD